MSDPSTSKPAMAVSSSVNEPIAEPKAEESAPTKEEETPEPLNFTLQVISNASEATLSFPHLPATTTIKQLKEKIRDSLPSKPESQRLIYRGRLLSRETDTMLDVFGQELLASHEPKNMHLVLPPAPPAPAESSAAIPAIAPESVLNNNAIPRAFTPTFPPRPQSTPLSQAQGMHAQQQLPGFQIIHQPQVIQHPDVNSQALRLQQMQREAARLYQDIGVLEQRMRALAPPNTMNAPQPIVGGMQVMFGVPQRQAPMAPFPPGFQPFQNLVHQHQRERAAQGLHGAQDIPVMPPTPGAVPGSGRASPNVLRPDHTTTYTREGIGPNGQRWQMTVNETTTTIPQDGGHHHHHVHHHPPPPPHIHAPLPPGFRNVQGPFTNLQMNHQVNIRPDPVQEIQAILRNADRLNHAQNHMQGIPTNPSAASIPPAAPTSSVPMDQRTETSGTPSTSNNSPPTSILPNSASQASVTANAQITGDTTAYILSSPSGPQALLVSNTGVYWTPRPSSRRHSPVAGSNLVQDPAAALPEFRNRPAHRPGRRQARNQPDNIPEVLHAPHANPGVGALVAQLLPSIWLLIRLGVFIWFFTSGNTSWTRLIIICGLALILFIANTGILNGVAEQLWAPIRQHLEALLPLAGPDAALVPAANAAPIAPAGRPIEENNEANPNIRRRRRAPEPTPAEAAARILAQRRQNQGWLFTQFRRAEHALLLFLASLVPGVGERHIAAREAEATAAEAERQRQIEAENAEEAAANAEAEQPAENSGNEVSGESASGNTEAPPADRLIEV